MLYCNNDNRLHFDLDFLAEGKHWPPVEDTRRLERYKFMREEFELVPEDMLMQIYPQGLLDLKDYSCFTHAVRLLGYPRLLTLKTTDMVIGAPPIISAQYNDGEEGTKKADEITEQIKNIRNGSSLNYHFKQALFDYSRFGVLLMRVFKDEKLDKALITAWDPNEWVPVFFNDGTRRIKQNVIGWRESLDRLKVQIHCAITGSYEERTYEIDSDGVIKSGPYDVHTYNTKSGKPLFFAIPNTPTTTNPLGASDYEIINAPLQKAIERLKAILRVLDEHADPSMTGPTSLLEKTESGELVFKTSKYYAVSSEDEKPSYITWEANLDSSFKAFEKLCEQLYILSEMGSVFLGTAASTGNAISGTAMRFKMVSPLEKARRICNDLTEPLKKIIASMLSIEGVDIEADDINIAWQDSLPKDPRETAELIKCESGCNFSKPFVHSVMDNFGVDLNTAEHYLDEILKEQERITAIVKPKTEGEPQPSDPRSKSSSMDPATDQNLEGADNKDHKGAQKQ